MVYVLTWLGYIDGIHVTIYSSTMDPMGVVKSLLSITHFSMAIHRATSRAPSLPLLPPSLPKVATSVRGGCPRQGDPGPRPWFWLVVLTILKNMKVSGKDDIPNMYIIYIYICIYIYVCIHIYIYMKWKIKLMFETTNHLLNIQYTQE